MAAAGHRGPRRIAGHELFWNPLIRILIVALLLAALVLLAVSGIGPSACGPENLIRAAC